MPRLSTESTEFADFVCCFLLDKLNNMDSVVPENLGNSDFEDFCKILKNKGVRSILLQYYMQLPAQSRVRYRLLRDVFITDKPLKTADIHIEKAYPKEMDTGKRTLLQKVIHMGLSILTGKERK